MVKHSVMGGKVHVYRRENSGNWQCSAYLNGKNRRTSTKESNLLLAKEWAESWYLELRGKHLRGELKDGKTFNDAAKVFMREYEVITEGQRNAKYVQDHYSRLRNHLLPFFGDKLLTEITPGLVQEYRVLRQTSGKSGKPPARNTMAHEIVTLRHVIKAGMRNGWLDHLHDFSPPYKASTKISHRAWFSPEEYKQFYEASRKRVKNAKSERSKYCSAQLHDYILFMANTGLRPDEVKRLEYRDVLIVDDEGTEETILEIEVRGKRGIGYAKSTSGAVRPYERLIERNNPAATDLVFPQNQKKLFNEILEEIRLKFDRDGNSRTAYSLRHTYICMRLMEGADIYQIAKNCRTSVEMIEKYYASHIKNRLDASLINVRKSRVRPVKFKSEHEKA